MNRYDPEIDNERIIRDCLEAHYGIRGRLSRLPGENLNYRVATTDGVRQVLKIVDDDMPADVVEMENAVIEHLIAAGFGYRLPKIIRNKQGSIETGIQLHKNPANRLRLLNFVDGCQLDSLSDISINLRFELGKFLAEFDRAVMDFDHPAAHRDHRWNLAEAGRHRGKIALFEDRKLQDLLGWAFDGWSGARDVLQGLPHQVIHGDAHGENVLVSDGRIVGLVDFGDCCFNPRICELGVCLPYLMMEQGDPLSAARPIIEGYHSLLPLSIDERSVLFPLVCARLAVTICVAEKRKAIDPTHPNWFGSTGDARKLLEWLHRHREAARKSLVL
jgi:Ser/Thr protein kinase RdoA (MazF antagonist)